MAEEIITTTTTEGEPKVVAATTTETTSAEVLGEAGKAALAAERKARREAESRVADFERQEKERADAGAKRQRDADMAKGEFEKVRTGLEQERDQAKAEAGDIEARYQRAIAVLSPDVDARWKDLPSEVASMYDGEADDVLAKAAHLNRTKALVDRLAGAMPRTGNGPNPRRIEGNGPTPEQTRDELRNSGAYAF